MTTGEKSYAAKHRPGLVHYAGAVEKNGLHNQPSPQPPDQIQCVFRMLKFQHS